MFVFGVGSKSACSRNPIRYTTPLYTRRRNLNEKLVQQNKWQVYDRYSRSILHTDVSHMKSPDVGECDLTKTNFSFYFKWMNNYLLPAILELCTYGKSIALPIHELIQWASLWIYFITFRLQGNKQQLHCEFMEFYRTIAVFSFLICVHSDFRNRWNYNNCRFNRE